MDTTAPGRLEIWYEKPMEYETHPISMAPGSFYELVPHSGWRIAKIKVSCPPRDET